MLDRLARNSGRFANRPYKMALTSVNAGARPYRCPVGRGVAFSRLPSYVSPFVADRYDSMILTMSMRSQVSPESIRTQSGRRPDST